MAGKSGSGKGRRDKFKVIFEAFCRAAKQLHVPDDRSERWGQEDDRQELLGIAGKLEVKMWKELVKATSIDAEHEQRYPSGRRRNDFTLKLPWGKIFNEAKGCAVPKGKKKRISDDAEKLLEEPPSCAYGLFILALSTLDDQQTGKWVREAVKTNKGLEWWDFELEEPITHEGLGRFKGQELNQARLYWFVKDARLDSTS